MKSMDRAVTLLVLLASATPVAAQSQADRLNQVLSQSGLSGSVIVTRAGSTVFSGGYGLANREHDVANTPGTKFRIGSITKQFTAMCVMILRDRGLLDVDDRVGDHVAGLPESWRNLTIHQLLTHTSGIMHSWNLPGFAETMAVPTTLDATLERFFDEPLLFEPGTSYAYSGTGYFLLARLIEVVSGESYAEFLQSEILDPLGMHETGADRQEPILLHRAAGYLRSEDGVVENAPDIYMPILTGGGNLYSTVEDMARWDHALDEHSLVSEQAYTSMYTPERNGYAYGWQVAEGEDGVVLFHSGGVPGFAAFNLRIPAEEIGVVILTNLTPARVPLRQLATTLARIVLENR